MLWSRYMNRISSVLFLILTVSTLVFSAEPLEKRVLSNGMTLITQEDHSRDIIAILTYVDGGNRTETPELAGLSHFFEHLIFRGGTDKQAELEMRKEFKALGTFYGYTFEDGTCYYIVVPSANLPDALDRYCDVMLNLKITEKKVETEKGIVLSEFSQSYFDIPSGMAYYNLYHTAFTKHPYGQTTIGDTAAVTASTLETYQKFYSERYTPDHFVTAAIGNFNTAELLEKIEKTFGTHPANNMRFELGKTEPPQTEFKQMNYTMPVSSVTFALGFHAIPYSAPEYPALEVLNQALSSGQGGIFDKELIRKKEIFNYLYSWADRTKEPGLWTFNGELPPEKLEKALPELFNILGKIAKDGLSDDYIAAAKGELTRAYLQNRESFLQRAETYCFYDLTSNLSLENLYIDRINAVTGEDITALARRIFTPENATLSLVIPEGMTAPDAKSYTSILQNGNPPVSAAKAQQIPAEEFTLNNGAVALLQEDRSSEMASLEILVRGGLWAEPAGKEGISELLCRLLTMGTIEFDGTYFSEALGKNGISLFADNNWDYSRISLSSTADNFLRGIELAGFAFTRTGFRDEDIASVRNEILAQIKSMPDQTYDLVHQEFDRLLYRKNPYSRPEIGYEQSISSINSEDLRKFQKSIYCGRNIVISAVGNFNKSEVFELLSNIFGEIEPGTQFAYKPAQENPPKSPKIETVDKERSQTTYNLGWAVPPVNSEEFLPLVFAQKMLGSTMFFRFVYEEGICYRMWTRISENIGPGKFWFETGITPENYNFSRSEVLKEFNSFMINPITDKMLSDAKAECIQSMQLNNETSSARAYTNARYYLLGFGPDYMFRYPHLVNSITAKQVKDAANKYLKKDGYTLLTVGRTEKK